MLKPEFRPSQLPEFTPPSPPQPELRKAAAHAALIALAVVAGLAYVLLSRYLTRLALAPAIVIGVLLSLHLAIVLLARLRQGQWLGLTGLLITALAILAADVAAGVADPGERMAPAGGYVTPPASPGGHWLVQSARAIADNAAPIVVILGALISSAFAVHNARPR